eukprot:SAG22_NODE_36_length_27184_cov_65.870076_2_plen_899_part_00
MEKVPAGSRSHRPTGEYELQVKWEGIDAEENTWETEAALPKQFLNDFWANEAKFILGRRGEGEEEEFLCQFVYQEAQWHRDNLWIPTDAFDPELTQAYKEDEAARAAATGMGEVEAGGAAGLAAAREAAVSMAQTYATSQRGHGATCFRVSAAGDGDHSGRHTKERLLAAVLAGDMVEVGRLVTAATSAPGLSYSTGQVFPFPLAAVHSLLPQRTLFQLAIQQKNLALLKMLVDAFPEARELAAVLGQSGESAGAMLVMLEEGGEEIWPWFSAAFLLPADGRNSSLESGAVKRGAILGGDVRGSRKELEPLQSLALAAITHGRRRVLEKCLRLLLDRQGKGRAGPGGVTQLHLLALVAADAAALVAGVKSAGKLKLDTFALNSGGLGKFITPTHLAGLNPNPEITRVILDSGGDETVDDDEGRSLMHYTAVCESPEPLEYVVARLDKAQDFSRATFRGLVGDRVDHDRYGKASLRPTPLLRAVRAGRGDNVRALEAFRNRMLVDLGEAPSFDIAKLQPKAAKKGTARKVDERNIIAAIESGELEIVRELLLDELNNLHLTGEVLFDSMLGCVQRLDFAMFGELFVDLWSHHQAGGWRKTKELELLVAAIRTLSLPFVKLLVEHCSFAVNNLANPERSPLTVAVTLGFSACAAFLIGCGAQVRQRDASGCSVLMAATRVGEVECVELLLANGAQVDATRDEDDLAMKEVAMEVDAAKEDDEDEGEDHNPAMPFEGWVVIITGEFELGRYQLTSYIERYGGRVISAVSGKVTHCLCGTDGVTEYGQNTGKGSKKYADCKKKKAVFVDEATVLQYVERVPKQESFQQKVEKEVVGTVIHDLMQFHVDNTELPLMVDFLTARSKSIYDLDEEGRTPLHCFVHYAQESPNTTAMLKAYLAKPS